MNAFWQRVAERTQHALAVGALRPSATRIETVVQSGIPFEVRVLENIKRKEAASGGKGERPNPFLPYDEDLFVADAGESHVLLLNKFPVIDQHILLVTRQFEPQTEWLTPRDFAALALCLAQAEGLAFYNGGKLAGASQPHRHLQLVPLGDAEPRFPTEATIVTARFKQGVGRASQFPFQHAIVQPGSDWHAAYTHALRAVGLLGADEAAVGGQTAPYNLLATREWLMVIPRSQEKFESISVNSLGFAGSFLTRDEAKLARVQALGPLQILAGVGVPPA